jgi:hypothetical protein
VLLFYVKTGLNVIRNSFTDKHTNPNLDGKTENARYRSRSFYHSATWPLILREEHRLREFENYGLRWRK